MKTLTKEITIKNERGIQFPILPNGTGWKSTENENLSVLESGDKKILLSKIVEAIDGAKELICLQSFLIQDTTIIDRLLQAVKERKVRVFILSSAEARLKDTIEDENDFIRVAYIQLINTKFRNHFVHRIAENFHAKYILVDPNTNPKGFICTNNFTENGFTKNPELAIMLSKDQCSNLYKIFVYHFWEQASDEQTTSNEFDKVRPAGKFALPEIKSILLTSPNNEYNTLEVSLLDAVKAAKQSISLSTFLLDKNEALIKELEEKAKNGLSIILFCRPIENQFDEHLKELLNCGIEIYFHPSMHAKTLLIDNSVGFLFTANLISNSLNGGLEVGAKLTDEQVGALTKIHQGWKANFPYKAIKQALVQAIREYFVFKDSKLTGKLLINDNKEKKQKISKVSDLILFFNQKYEIQDHNIKSLEIKLIAELNILPEKFMPIGNGKFEIMKIENPNGQKEEWVVVGNEFNQADLEKLLDYKELKIFYQKDSLS